MIRILKNRYSLATALLASLTLSVLLFGCKTESVYEVKLDAIRVIDQEAEGVNLSVWLYDVKGNLIRHVFTQGVLDPAISGREWVTLDDPEFKPMSAEAIPDPAHFVLEIKLNPNRFATPPDAVFYLTANLENLQLNAENAHDQVVTSESGAYQLRLSFRKRSATG